jgi:hypothetical protein
MVSRRDGKSYCESQPPGLLMRGLLAHYYLALKKL